MDSGTVGNHPLTSSMEEERLPTDLNSGGVAGVILAAGESSRMGRDKALLLFDDETFLQHLINVLRDEVSPLVVVLGHHASEIERQIVSPSKSGDPIAPAAGVIVLRNPDYRLGQLSSLHVALRYLILRPASGILISLVDHPAISKKIVRLLLARFKRTQSPILIPTYRGRRGHPVLFARSLFQELMDAPLDEGARFVIHRHAAMMEEVEMDEEAILIDVDHPEDYRVLLAKRRPKSAEDDST